MAQNVSPPEDPYHAIAALADSGQVEAAERQARELVARAPEDHDAWRVLGYALLTRNRYPEAESALKHAIELAPQDGVAFEHLGWIYHRTNRLPQAAEALKAGLAILPDRLRSRVILANVMAAAGKPQHAIAHFERALKQEPRHFRAHNNLANVLVGVGRLKDAAAHYAEAAKLAPDLTYKISAAHQARRIGDWETAEALEPAILSGMRPSPRSTDRISPFPLLAMPGITARDQLSAGRQMAGHHKSLAPVPRQQIARVCAQRRFEVRGRFAVLMTQHRQPAQMILAIGEVGAVASNEVQVPFPLFLAPGRKLCDRQVIVGVGGIGIAIEDLFESGDCVLRPAGSQIVDAEQQMRARVARVDAKRVLK